jgi:hypothetical protein
MSLTGNPALRIQIEGTPYETVTVPADTAKLVRVYVVAPADSAPAEDERTEFRFWVEDITNGDRAHAESIFNGRSN